MTCSPSPHRGRYWYKNGFNPKAIAALVPSVAVCLVLSFIPALHEVANFSWFIGAFLSAGCYRWIARHEREGVTQFAGVETAKGIITERPAGTCHRFDEIR